MGNGVAIIPTANNHDNKDWEKLKELSLQTDIKRDEVRAFIDDLNDKNNRNNRKYIVTLVNILNADKFKIDESEYVYAKTAKEVGLGDNRFQLAKIIKSAAESMYGRLLDLDEVA